MQGVQITFQNVVQLKGLTKKIKIIKLAHFWSLGTPIGQYSTILENVCFRI